MSISTIIIIALVVVLIWFVAIYNRLISMIEEVNNNKQQIDIQLDRRYKVYESLIEVVKKYMDYEKSTLKEVVALRNQAQQAHAAGDEKARIVAEDAISKVGSGISLIFEQYPDLKANQNALQLQEEIVNTENKLAFSKQAYNDSIERYNAKRKSLLESFIVNLFQAKLLKDFIYWGIADVKRQQYEDSTVKF